MSKTESTAINQLISIARTSKPVVDPTADLFRSPPPGAKAPMPAPLAIAPQATERIPQAQIQAKAIAVKQAAVPRSPVGTPPPSMLTLQRKPLPPASGTRMDTPLPGPVPADPTTGNSPWFDNESLADALEPGYTEQVKRERTATFKLVRRLALPLVGFVALGAAVGTYIALNSRDKKAIAPIEVKIAPEPAPVVAPPPKPMVVTSPVVEEVAPPVAQAKLIDVRIDSQPLGATVMLVDRGKTSFLGTTPIATSLDSAHGYDLVFSIDGRPTQMAHLDPTQQQKIEVAFPAVHHAAAPLPVAAPVEHREAPPAAKQVATSEGGTGTLMISSKPPCQIIVDGSPTGLTTPQRSISLPAGHHSVTLTSAEDPSVKRTVSVEINANKPTKVIQDLMK